MTNERIKGENVSDEQKLFPECGIELRRNIRFELYVEKGERQQSPLFASCGHSGGWVGRQGLTIGPERNFFVHFFHLNGGQEQLQAGDHKTAYNANGTRSTI